MSDPIKCTLIKVEPLVRVRKEGATAMIVNSDTFDKPVPGDMFFVPRDSEGLMANYLQGLSAWYHAHNIHRDPLVVVLPTGMHFVIDQKYWGGAYGENPEGLSWEVTGEAPLITMKPSINIVGHWHGFLENGELRTC